VGAGYVVAFNGDVMVGYLAASPFIPPLADVPLTVE
jgi:hypothetical protein